MKQSSEHFILSIPAFAILYIFYGFEDAVVIVSGFYICLLSYAFTVRNDRKKQFKHKRTTPGSSLLPGFYEHRSSNFQSVLHHSFPKMWKSLFSRKETYSLNHEKSSTPSKGISQSEKENIYQFHHKRSSNLKESDSFNKLNFTPKLNSTASKNDSFHTPGKTHLRSYTSTPVLAAAGPLLSAPIIPNVKRALEANGNVEENNTSHNRSNLFGFNDSFIQDSSFTRSRSLNRSSSLYVPNHPSSPSPGIVPHVRLYKQRPRLLSEERSSMLRRSNTVKIAPPDPVRSTNTSLTLHSSTCPPDQVLDSSLDSQAVLTALKDKRKRSHLVQDEVLSEVPSLQAKRRRQESSESTSTCSSLPPLPDNLPDLSLNSTEFPERQSSTSLKRPALFADDWDPTPNPSAKKQKSGSILNSLISSLSSSKRVIQKESLKRRCSYDDSRSRSVTPKFPRSETPVSLTSISESEQLGLYEKEDTIEPPVDLQEKRPQTPSCAEPKIVEPKPVKATSIIEDQDTKESNIQSKEKQEEMDLKKLLPGAKKLSLKRSHISISSPINKLFKKVPSANVLALPEDYQRDREVELERVKQMLSDIDKSEKQDKTDNAVPATTSPVSTIAAGLKVTSSLLTTVTTTVSTSAGATVNTPIIFSSITQPQKDGAQPASTTSASIPASGTATQSEVKPAASSPSYTFKPVFGVQASPASTAPSTMTKPSGMGIGGYSFPANSSTTSSVASSAVSPSLIASHVVSTSAATSTNSLVRAPFTGLSVATSIPNALNLSKSVNQNDKMGSSTAPTATASSNAMTGFSFNTGGISSTGLPQIGNASTAPSTANITTGQVPAMNFSAQTGGTNSVSTGQSISSQFGVASNPLTATNSFAPQNLQTSNQSNVLPSSAGFQFGQINNAQVTSTPNTVSAPQTSIAGNNFQFGTAGNRPSNTAGFQFGQATTQQSAPSTAPFGQTTAQTAATTQPTPATVQFGQGFNQQSSTTPFPFGQNSSQQSTPAAPQFGQTASQQATPTALQFGQTTQQQPSSGITTFGSSNNQQTTSFQFGSGSNQPATTAPQFGQGFAQPSQVSAAPISTSQAPAPSNSGNPFGTTSTTGVGFQFGQSNNSQTTHSGTNAFQTGPATTTTTGSAMFAFGQTKSTQPTTSNSFQFGSSTTTQTSTLPQTPAFGQTSSTTGFNFNAATTKNGNSSIAKNLFGGTTTTANENKTHMSGKNLFGAPQTQNAPAFGQSTTNLTSGQKAQSFAFGQTNSTTPAFGSQTNNSGSFTFGQKTTAPAFGSSTTTATTQPTTATGVFSFGSASSQQTTPTKGFNFNASASNGPQFNFGGGGAAPSTNFATPSGQNSSFSMGAAPKGRVVTKARRKGGKK